MCEVNCPSEDEITKAVNSTIALFDYFLNRENHQEKPDVRKYVSESQEDAIKSIACIKR